MQETATNPNNFIPSTTVREMCGNVSDVTIWRWLHEARYQHLNFPRPCRIATRLYWRKGDVEAWLAHQMDKAS